MDRFRKRPLGLLLLWLSLPFAFDVSAAGSITVQGVLRDSVNAPYTYSATNVKFRFKGPGACSGGCDEATGQTVDIVNGAFSASLIPTAALAEMAANSSGWTFELEGQLASGAPSAIYSIPLNSLPFASVAEAAPWSGISGKPTTLAGYGITDAVSATSAGMVMNGLAADPGTPAEGQVWYNTTDNVLRYYDGGAVRTLTGGGSGDVVQGGGAASNRLVRWNTAAAKTLSNSLLSDDGTQVSASASAAAAGLLRISNSSATGYSVHAVAGNAGAIPLVLEGAAAQTGSLLQWQSNTPTTLGGINAAGSLFVGAAPLDASIPLSIDVSAAAGRRPALMMKGIGFAGTGLYGVMANDEQFGILTNTNPGLTASYNNAEPSWKMELWTGADRFAVSRAPATAGVPAFSDLLTISNSGNVGVGNTANSKLDVSGTIVSRGYNQAAVDCVDGAVDINWLNGNVQIIRLGATISNAADPCTLNMSNMQVGGAYTLIVEPTTMRQYNFKQAGIATWKYQPANAQVSGETVYTMILAPNATSDKAYVSWVSGY